MEPFSRLAHEWKWQRRNASFTSHHPFISALVRFFAFFVSTSRLMSRSKGLAHVRMSAEREMSRRASVDAIFFLLLLLLLSTPLHPGNSLFSGVFEADHLGQIPSEFTVGATYKTDRGALTYYSRARLRNTRDRSIASRSIESWIHVVFAARCCLHFSFCLRLGSLAMPDVVESNLSSLFLLIFFVIFFFFFAISSLFLPRHRSLLSPWLLSKSHLHDHRRSCLDQPRLRGITRTAFQLSRIFFNFSILR